MSEDISLRAVAQRLFAHRRWIIAGGAVGFALALIVVLVQPLIYQSAVTVTGVDPSGSDSRLIGVASQFGIGDLAGPRGSGIVPTPDFIGQISSSAVILHGVLQAPVSPDVGGAQVPLIDLIAPLKPSSSQVAQSAEARQDAATRRLRSMIVIRKNKLTNSTTIVVTTKWAPVSYETARAMVTELNRLFLQLRRSQAEEERRFSLGRIADRQRDLRAAEEQLSAFLLRNREFRNAPVLVAEYERFQRQVNSQTQVLTGLMQSYDDAGIRAARDTPLLLVIDPPAIAVNRQSRHLVVSVALGAVAGGLLAIVAALIKTSRKSAAAA